MTTRHATTDDLRAALTAAIPGITGEQARRARDRGAGMSDVAILRRAANLLRDKANAATPGPWSCANEHELLGPEADPAWCISQMKPGYESMSPTDGYVGDLAEVWCDDRGSCPDGEYIALMHPPVALALADWLDDHADAFSQEVVIDLDGGAIDVARAVLREVGE